jgi:hypothetical protein
VSDEKPLHVRTAEALGWTFLLDGEQARGAWYANPPDSYAPDVVIAIPRYDTDWSAGGPLIEKYQLSLHTSPEVPGWFANAPRQGWRGEFGRGETPLIAACNMILLLADAAALKEAGKL